MKKLICIVACLLLISSTIIVAGAESTELEFYNSGYLYSTCDPITNSWSGWIFGNSYDSLPWCTSKGMQLASQNLLYVSSIDYLVDGKFELFHTYHISYSLRTTENADIKSWNLGSIKVSNLGGLVNYKKNPLYYTSSDCTTIGSVFDYSSVFVTNTYDSNYITLDIIFSVTSDTDFYYILPMFYYHNSTSDTVKGVYLQLDSVTGVYDYDQEIYQETTSQLQQQIKNTISSGFMDVNNNLNDIENVLKDDPNHTPDTSPLKDDLAELEDLENGINDSITKPITLPDGSRVQVDANTLLNLKSWYKDYYNAPEYDAFTGGLYAKIFEAFMPYLGTVIFSSLLLGLIVAFLTGRRST